MDSDQTVAVLTLLMDSARRVMIIFLTANEFQFVDGITRTGGTLMNVNHKTSGILYQIWIKPECGSLIFTYNLNVFLNY